MKFIDANVMYIFIVNVIKVLSHELLIQIISFIKETSCTDFIINIINVLWN